MKAIIIYLVAVNLAAMLLFGLDKHKAKTHQWRIPEKTLFGIALLGGSIGAIVGMQLFRHKTKHWYFVIGMPTIFVLQLVIVFMLKYLVSKGF